MLSSMSFMKLTPSSSSKTSLNGDVSSSGFPFRSWINLSKSLILIFSKSLLANGDSMFFRSAFSFFYHSKILTSRVVWCYFSLYFFTKGDTLGNPSSFEFSVDMRGFFFFGVSMQPLHCVHMFYLFSSVFRDSLKSMTLPSSFSGLCKSCFLSKLSTLKGWISAESNWGK